MVFFVLPIILIIKQEVYGKKNTDLLLFNG